MININLLDWRLKKTQIENNKLFIMIGAAVIVCAIVIGFIDIVIQTLISDQKSDIEYLSQEITLIEGKIKSINSLQEQKTLLLTRRKVIESLQESRSFSVKIFDNIVRVVPNGVVFNEMSRKTDELLISGVADSNSSVSAFMKNVQRLRWVKEAKLAEIKAAAEATASKQSANKKAAGSSKQDTSAADRANVDSIVGKVAFQIKITIDGAGGANDKTSRN